jgi:hypothetical protein
MSNDAYISDDSYLQQQMDLEHQEFELYQAQLASEHEDYLLAITTDLYGSSVARMTEFN